MYMSRLQDEFVQTKYICPNYKMYLPKLSNVFVQNYQMYLSRLPNEFVQIAKCIPTNPLPRPPLLTDICLQHQCPLRARDGGTDTIKTEKLPRCPFWENQ